MKRTNYTTEFVEQIPEQLEDGVLYVAPHFNVAMHKCMCGCGEKVCTPLLKDIGWEWSKQGNDVSLAPSIGNLFHYPCKSHYFLTQGKVKWC